jgi:TBC1 domain family protein 5
VVEADTNEALMLLMRYPSPDEQYGPRTFVLDARYLCSNANFEAGNDLIKKYSNRVPPPFKRQPQRPSTPEYSASPSTPQRSGSPFVSPGFPKAFESLINDTARGVITRGEKWGFNQAVRDAVGEVRKNVQNIQAGRGSPHTRPGHRGSRSSEVSGNIAANVLRKITALEDRNKQLAKMLEGAVVDLWSCEKEASDKKSMSKETLNALSVAVARVQFVQVFLQDSTLPLPQEENPKPAITDNAVKEEKHDPLDPPHQVQTDSLNFSETSIKQPPPLAPSPILAIVMPTSTGSPPPSLPTTFVSAHHASATAPSLAQAPSNHQPNKSSNASRPRIGESNYSWMLGQARENSSEFVRASPFAPAEKRQHATKHGKDAKSFLFGEDDVVGERRVVKGRARKGSKDVRKGGRTDSPAPEHEDIGLDDVKGEIEGVAPI